MGKAWAFIKRHKILSTIAAIVLLIIIFLITRGGSKPSFEIATAAVGNVVETVSVTGTVSPVDKADLAFEKSGVVSRIDVKVGDQVRAGDEIASLDSASDQAAYDAAEASYEDTARGLRPVESAAEAAKVSSAQTTLANAEVDAVNADHQAYAEAQGALVNYTDSLFSNPSSVNPVISIVTDSYDTKSRIDQERVEVTEALSLWAGDLAQATSSSAASDIATARTRLAVVKTFVSDLSSIVGALTTANSGLSQSSIDAYTASVNSALSAVNTASNSLASAETSLASDASALAEARTAYDLKAAGNSSDAIAAAKAKADQAAAELAKDTIRAPMDGTITEVVPDIGEFVAAGATEFSVQSLGSYKIEAYVPEADIAKVAVGDLASTTLDAYGPDVDFESRVIAIDPAETVLEGVPTYKVTLVFGKPDSRIRSGMTANLDILTHVRSGVLAIPFRAVMDENGVKTVRLLDQNGTSYSTTTVVTGLRGSDGQVEIVSGLQPGQKVVTYVK